MNSILFQKKDLMEKLSLATGVADGKRLLPILQYGLMDFSNEKQRLVVADDDTELQAQLGCLKKQGKNLSFLLPVKKIFDLCRTAPDEEPIEMLLLSDQRLRVSFGDAHFHFTTLPAHLFPQIVSKQTPHQELKMDARNLYDLLEKTVFSVSQQDIRQYLKGLLLFCEPHQLSAVSADSHRLSLAVMPRGEEILDTESSENWRVLLPRKAVLEMLKILDSVHGPVVLRFFSQRFQLCTSELSLTTQLIDSQFPDYNVLFAQSYPYSALISQNSLKQALQRLLILTPEKNKAVRLIFQENSLTLRVGSLDQEGGEDVLPVEYVGPTVELAFNGQYLMDVLQISQQKTFLKFHFEHAEKSLLITNEDGEIVQVRYVIMPLRL